VGVQRLSNSGRSGFSYKSLIAGITPIPSVPTIGTATALTSESVSVTFTAPGAYSGATYTATSSPDGITASSATSPIVVTGLLAETAYTFTVTATNATGTSGASAASNSATTLPGATASMDALATVVVPSGGVSQIEFAGIPTGGQYQHLQIRFIGRLSRSSAGTGFQMRFNDVSTTAAYYQSHRLQGNGSSATAGADGTNTVLNFDRIAAANNSANVFGAGIIDILDYTSINKNKVNRSLIGYDDNGSGQINLNSNMWLTSNTAINKIVIYPDGFTGTWVEHSQFALYGIRG
jgi:hypothetical protein